MSAYLPTYLTRQQLMEETDVFASLTPLFERKGPFSPANFEEVPASETLELVADTRVLVVGAGGLGCEALKNLVCSGFKDIDLVDMDTVDISNLNRQFLFRQTDVNKFKCEAAARFIMDHRPGVTVRHHTKRIQEFPRRWFRNFQLVVACLDNEEARLWLNEMLADSVDYEDAGADDGDAEQTFSGTNITARTLKEVNPDTVTPLVDGGTEGWNGQARMLLPGNTYCLQCSAATAPPAAQTHFHLCTIAHVPRTPEHCVMYAQLLLWPRLYSLDALDVYELAPPVAEGGPAKDPAGVDLDKDDELHMTWLWARASERARQFNIAEPSYTLTMQVVKNIIPAIASTNALISAAGVAEALKHITATAPLMKQYFLYTGSNYTTGVNCQTYPYNRNPKCSACHARTLFTVPAGATLAELLTALDSELRFERTSLRDLREENPVAAQVYMASNASDAALRPLPVSEVLKPNRVYLAAGPGRQPLKFQVAFQK